MECFCRLASPSSYNACAWDFSSDQEGLTYWVDFFKRQVGNLMKVAIEWLIGQGVSRDIAEKRAAQCQRDLESCFEAVRREPHMHGRITIIYFDILRDQILRQHGFDDPYADLKDRENERMLPLLPAVCRELDALDGQAQIRAMIEGVFAGNIFDMGVDATAKAFMHKGPDFFATRSKLPARPWLVDDYDALSRRLLDGPPHRKAIYFIDNAGSDFLLGVLPMIRWLAQRGTCVVLTANELPSLNDMTIHDVNRWWPRIVEAEPSLARLPIERVSSGTGEPLIDLRQISPQLNAAAADADLIILEGMGRGVESNIETRFDVDGLSLAMIKDPFVAKRLGGKVYDVVCRFCASG